jgi:hypothetical protein
MVYHPQKSVNPAIITFMIFSNYDILIKTSKCI